MSGLEKIRERRSQIKSLRAALDREEGELDIAEAVFTRLEGGAVRRIPTARKPVSQRDFVLETLSQLENPWAESSTWLREQIREKHGVDIPVSSFQPLIWSLTAKDHLIARDGKKLALKARVG